MPTQLLPHAYAEWEGCLRGSFPRLGAYAGASAGFFVGWPCWMAMFAAMFTVAVLNAWCWLVWTPSWALKWSWLPLAPFMCDVSKNERMTIYCCASKWSRCLRAASAEPTRAYAVEPKQIPRNHLLSLYASPAAHTPATIYARICVDKLVDNLHIPSHLKSANEHLPTQLCLRNKNLHCFRGCLRTPPRTVKYQVVSLRDFIRSSLEYIMPCIKKKTMLSSATDSLFLPYPHKYFQKVAWTFFFLCRAVFPSISWFHETKSLKIRRPWALQLCPIQWKRIPKSSKTISPKAGRPEPWGQNPSEP